MELDFFGEIPVKTEAARNTVVISLADEFKDKIKELDVRLKALEDRMGNEV